MNTHRMLVILVIQLVALAASNACGADRMVCLVPATGSGMLVKRFALEDETTIHGAWFASNDPSTIFPHVWMLRGTAESLSPGSIVGCATAVEESAPGIVTIDWQPPVEAGAGEIYYLAVCMPEGSRRLAPGVGAGIGANNVLDPNGSYLTSGFNRCLIPIRAELEMHLATDISQLRGVLETEEQSQRSKGPTVARTRLSTHVLVDQVLIRLSVYRDSPLTLWIVDVSGRRVQELLNGPIRGGYDHELTWDRRDQHGRPVGAGMYFVNLRDGTQSFSQKVVLTKR